jgi:hypothetical protein
MFEKIENLISDKVTDFTEISKNIGRRDITK